MTTRTSLEMDSAAHAVIDQWRLVVHLGNHIRAEESAGTAARNALFAADRALILFLCGGERGQRDGRDIQPSDFLGHDWFVPDEEMDQRLRGRLRVMSKTQAHLTWWSVTDESMVIWPYDLIVQEISWSMAQFVAEIRRARVPQESIFAEAMEDLRSHIPTKRARVSTSECGPPRPGQVDRR